MNELTRVFEFEGLNIATIVKGEEVFFVGVDVATALGYKIPRDAVAKKVDREDVFVEQIVYKGQRRTVKLLNESGVYSLIFSSELESAKKFKKWVTSEVLPTIRKHGAYMTDDALAKTLNDPDYMIGLLTALKDEKLKRVEAEKTVNILTHVNKTYTATEIAKELGFKSATALNRDLQNRKIQFNQNGTWVFYSKFADKGYVDIKQEVLDNGKVIYHRRFTQMGREFLLKLYEKKEA